MSSQEKKDSERKDKKGKKERRPDTEETAREVLCCCLLLLYVQKFISWPLLLLLLFLQSSSPRHNCLMNASGPPLQGRAEPSSSAADGANGRYKIILLARFPPSGRKRRKFLFLLPLSLLFRCSSLKCISPPAHVRERERKSACMLEWVGGRRTPLDGRSGLLHVDFCNEREIRGS